MSNFLPTLYQEFIYKSRYSRWLEDEKRRENWDETITRYFDFMENHLKQKHNYVLEKNLRKELEEAVLNLEVMPSMRSLMTAGPALERDNTAAFNCSYLPVDDPKSFDEAMVILMNGTGVGFSVERQYVQKLPEIPDQLFESDTTIVVKDSKEGWGKALRQLIALLYSGEIPKWNTSKLRPAGARLKTFGGRSSGPEPLEELFRFVVQIFKNAVGRKLNSLECHDIMCKIGEVVVVGGVRRSAMISLSNLSDERMRHAKSGSWWETNPQRALANNSAAYTEKPDIGVFMREWNSLYDSKSGERGIFSRVAAEKQAKKFGRRDPDHEWGTNPCFTEETLVAVADGRNAVSIKELADLGVEFPVYSARRKLNSHSGWKTEVKTARAFKTGVRKIIKVVLSDGSEFRCTEDHKLATPNDGYVQAKNSMGLELEGFFTKKHKNYRMINTNSNGYNYQHRMIWEYYNGPKLEGHEIDHIDSTSDDCIDNLQLLTREDHLRKTSQERMGLNNPVHKIADREGWVSRIRVNSYRYNNPMYLGATDEDIISAALELKDLGVKINFNNLRQINSKIPKSFSKNRFGGNIKNLIDIVNGVKEYIPPVDPFYEETVENLFEYENPTVVNIIHTNEVEDVYDLNVDDNHNFYILTQGSGDFTNSTGVLVHNCSEIILRPYQFCNLTEVVVRPTDTEKTLLKKTRLASILGTFQSTLTNFPYLRKIWKKNTEEERLLGVSMTGIMDNSLTNGKDGIEKLQKYLEKARDHAVAVNEEFANVIGIEVSTAVTCLKPSGTVSQLVDAASGIHARHNEYYIRTVRGDNKDPLTQFMIQKGFPAEPCVMKPNTTTVFSFPIKSPPSAVTRTEMSAIEQLEMWLIYQRHWCEHKPSVTISVKEHEWMEVGAFVYKHFDEMSGVSFLPHTDHVYKQAPYQDCNEEQYKILYDKMPSEIDWEELAKFEFEDMTSGNQTFACSADGCEIVDLTG